jgi:predicted transcriptional regulator
MSTIDDKLNEALNIAAAMSDAENDQIIATTQAFKTKENTELTIPENKTPDVDFETGRENLYKLLDKGNEAIDGILALAKEGEHPRAYEVAGQLIKTVSEVSQNLLDLQEKLKRIKDVPNTAPKNVTNALFVGSTTELQKLLKGNKIKTVSEQMQDELEPLP